MWRIRELLGLSRRDARLIEAILFTIVGAFAFTVWSIQLGRELEDR